MALSLSCRCLPARLSDPQPHNLEGASPGDHAVILCGREFGAHERNHCPKREAVRAHDRLGAAVRRGVEQGKRAVALGGSGPGHDSKIMAAEREGETAVCPRMEE